MTLDKFTIKAQEAVQEAVRIAEARRQQAIEQEHLLAAILKTGQQVTQFLFRKLSVNEQAVSQALRDVRFVGKDGGVTFSGGEPLLQPAFVSDCIQLLKSSLKRMSLKEVWKRSKKTLKGSSNPSVISSRPRKPMSSR